MFAVIAAGLASWFLAPHMASGMGAVAHAKSSEKQAEARRALAALKEDNQ